MIFVDTGAWIAILNRRDQHHQEASAIYRNLQQQLPPSFSNPHFFFKFILKNVQHKSNLWYTFCTSNKK